MPQQSDAETWSIYECDRIQRGQSPQNERLVETGFATPIAAMVRANEMKLANRDRSYVVG